MEIELFYVRYAADSGYVLRSDDVGEFLAGLHRHLPAHWTTEEHAHADRAERLFRAWSCVRHDEHREWVAFAAIADGTRIIIGVEAVSELLVSRED